MIANMTTVLPESCMGSWLPSLGKDAKVSTWTSTAWHLNDVSPLCSRPRFFNDTNFLPASDLRQMLFLYPTGHLSTLHLHIYLLSLKIRLRAGEIAQPVMSLAVQAWGSELDP